MDLIKFIKDFPYWKQIKLQIYYILHPIAHFKLLLKTAEKLKTEKKYKEEE